MKKKIAALGAFVLFFCLPFTVWGGDDLSKGQILDTLLQTAPSYTEYIAAEDIVSGYAEGDFRSEKLATDVEMLVMISRAFPNMPEPKGNNIITMPEKFDTSLVPEWAQSNFEYLASRGIVSANTQLDDSVTKDELNTYLKRVWRYYGTDIKDDFYTSVNSSKLGAARPNFDIYTGSFAEVAQSNSYQIKNIISEIVKKGAPDKREQKIKSIYLSALEMQREKGDLGPLMPYLDRISAAGNMTEYVNAIKSCDKEIYSTGLIGFKLSVDIKNTDNYIPMFDVYEPTFSYEDFTSDIYKPAFINYVSRLFVLGGESSRSAALKAEKIYDFEKNISVHCLSSADSADAEMTYNLWTLSELQQLYSFIDLEQLAKDEGFDIKPDDKVMVPDVGLTYNLALVCREDVELAKDLSKLSLIAMYGDTMSLDCLKASEKFRSDIYGTNTTGLLTVQDRAINFTENYMGEYLSEIYCEKYLDEKDVENVRQITESLVEHYKQKIAGLDWMSEQTKQKAIKKLDAMNIKIGYGTGSVDILENAAIRYDNTLFENCLAIKKANLAWMNSVQKLPVDRDIWSMAAYEANACYLPIRNEMVLPAGILKAPFYSSKASYEENMGGIGTVIAHELSHAFDNTGAMYDEKGDYINWWTDEDYRMFSDKCVQIAASFDGEEAATDIPTNGRLTVGEAIADLGGVTCASEVVMQKENADMKKFYYSFAKIWEIVIPREYIYFTSVNDPHPSSNVRVNMSLANLDNFVDTFNIQPGDGMYIPKEERVGIW